MTGNGRERIAFVDESMQQGPGGIYVVGAAIVLGSVDEVREAARAVLLKGQRRFHWHEENEKQRLRMIETIRSLPLRGVAFVCRPMGVGCEQRARAVCVTA